MLTETLNKIIENSQEQTIIGVYNQYKSLFATNTAKPNYFVLTEDQWNDFEDTVKGYVGIGPDDTSNFMLGIIDILTNEILATNNSPVGEGSVNGLYIYYAQEFDNMGKSGAVNPVDPYLKEIVPNYDAIMMFANWNSSALWTCEILHRKPNTTAPKMFYFKIENNNYRITYNNKSGCFKIDNNNNGGYKELSNYPSLKDGNWKYIYSPDVPASNFNGKGLPTYESNCESQIRIMNSLNLR